MDQNRFFGEEGIVVDQDNIYKQGKDLNELINEMRNHGLLVDHLDKQKALKNKNELNEEPQIYIPAL